MKSKIWPHRPRKWPLDLNDLGNGSVDFFENVFFEKILGDLSVLENGSLKYFENGLKSMQIFQRFMGGMNRR